MTYLERKIERGPRKGRMECSLDGGMTWTRLLPISFTAENAQKCFDRAKTQFRLLLNPQPPASSNRFAFSEDGFECATRDGELVAEWQPRYRVGDVLVLQEPWRTVAVQDKWKPTLLPPNAPIYYEGAPVGAFSRGDAGKLRPARFLPLRFARPARYLVTAVKCERVSEISEADAKAEGVTDTEVLAGVTFDCGYRINFGRLWNSIHPKPGTRFEDGPWAFVFQFERIL